MNTKINFASDNYAGVSSSVFEWLQKVNDGASPAYGGDDYTQQALKLFKQEFGESSETFFVWNGTSANVLGLQSLLHRHEAILCSDVAHIQMDECGAPERHTGAKLIAVPTEHGKLNPESLKKYFARKGDVHAVQPRAISLTQSTECGTVYSIEEVREISAFARGHGLFLHIDGARIANAAAALSASFRQLTVECGVDILSFGGTKNGLMGAEAVVVLNPKFSAEFPYIRKQGMHLASKMRYVSAQFLAYFENRLWEKNAAQANRMTKLLEQELQSFPDKIRIVHPVQANEIFCVMPADLIEKLQQKFYFYVWNEVLHEVRLVCTFQTTEDEVRAFTKEIKNFF